MLEIEAPQDKFLTDSTHILLETFFWDTLYFVFCILCFVFCIFVFYLQFSVCKTDANKGLAILPETSEPGIGSGAVRTFQTNKLSNKGLL